MQGGKNIKILVKIENLISFLHSGPAHPVVSFFRGTLSVR